LQALLVTLLHILPGKLAPRNAVPINAFNGFDELGKSDYLFVFPEEMWRFL